MVSSGTVSPVAGSITFTSVCGSGWPTVEIQSGCGSSGSVWVI